MVALGVVLAAALVRLVKEELIKRLRDLDPTGARQVVVDHEWEPGWVVLESRDVGESAMDGKWVVVVQKTKYGDDDD